MNHRQSYNFGYGFGLAFDDIKEPVVVEGKTWERMDLVKKVQELEHTGQDPDFVYAASVALRWINPNARAANLRREARKRKF